MDRQAYSDFYQPQRGSPVLLIYEETLRVAQAPLRRYLDDKDLCLLQTNKQRGKKKTFMEELQKI